MEANICDASVLFGASALMSIAGAITKSSSDMASYDRKIEAANAEADAINRSTIFKYATAGLQEMQVQNQATVKEGQARERLSGAEGEAAAAAGGGGVTGSSVQQLYRAYNVATGSDIMNLESDEKGQIGQAEDEKKSDQMSAQNQILSIKEGLPSDPTNSIIGNYVGAALGIGASFMKDTTPVTNGSGGLFNAGGILGIGRAWN